MGEPRISSETNTGWGGKSPFNTRTLPIIFPTWLACAPSRAGMARHNRSAKNAMARGLLSMADPTEYSQRCYNKGKKACHRNRQQAFENVQFGLEAELHAELHFTRVKSACSLTESADWLKVAGITAEGCVLVIRSATRSCEDEVRTIEYVKRIRVKLHVDPLGDSEGLGEGHISGPIARTDKAVSTEATHASQAWR